MQLTFFDNPNFIESESVFSKSKESLNNDMTYKFNNYTLDDYCCDIKSAGLEKTWSNICDFLLSYGESLNGIIKVSDFGDLYEYGLAFEDKYNKKSSGQYYTPNDVSLVLSQWFDETEGYNICDVGCGSGNLILSYLDLIGRDRAEEILSSGRLYLYDNDKIALNICKTTILFKYGLNFSNKIHDICCDFLDKNIVLPENCKVISNPPYATITQYGNKWNITQIIADTKEYYAAFMEKILHQSTGAVIITPYSFMGGRKFYSLRKAMNDHSGFIVSFDNVPGNVFQGKKHGIFNTNTSNSVRAAITVVQNKNNIKGFKVSPLIRFKNEEREKLFNTKVLEKFVSKERQIITQDRQLYYKCDSRLTEVFKIWTDKSTASLSDYISKDDEGYRICVPNTCRYFSVASDKNLNRSGKITIRVQDKDVYNYIFCMINSSFAYWHWRLYDGGITYQKNTLLDMPLFFDLLTEQDKEFFKNMTGDMISNANKYTVYKNNVGKQENIKYPKQYRDKINKRIFQILGIDKDSSVLDIIHSNMALEISV